MAEKAEFQEYCGGRLYRMTTSGMQEILYLFEK